LNAAVCDQLASLKPQLKSYRAAEQALASGEITVSTPVVDAKEGEKKTTTVTRKITDEERAGFQAVVDKSKDSIANLEATIEQLGSCKFRFSGNVDEFVASVCDQLVTELAVHAKSVALKSGLKIVQVEHLYGAGLELLSFFPLISGTELYRSTHSALYAKRGQDALEQERAATAQQTERDLRKKWKSAGLLKQAPRKKKDVAAPAEAAPAEQPAAQPVEPAVEAPKPAEHPGAKSLHHFIQQLVEQAGGEEFKNMRKGSGLVCHISELVRQFIVRIVSQLNHLMRLSDAKTVTRGHLRCIIQCMLTDGQQSIDTISTVDEQVADPKLLRAEREKQASEKAAGRTYTFDASALPKVTVQRKQVVSTFQGSAYAAVESLLKQE
jgi:hypothetical protein